MLKSVDSDDDSEFTAGLQTEIAMDYDTIAATRLRDVIQRPSTGEPVNVHVVSSPQEPKPDFEKMNRLVSSDAVKPEPTERKGG